MVSSDFHMTDSLSIAVHPSLPRWRHWLLWHYSRCAARRHISPIPLYHLCCILICIYVQHILTQWIKTSEEFFKKIYLSLYWKGSKRVTQGFTVRGSWRPNRTATYWPPLLWPSALCPSCSPGLLNRRLGGPLAGCRLSLQDLVTNGSPNSLGGPEGPFCWLVALSTTSLPHLSLPHLVSNSSDLQLTNFLSSPSYIIVQSPTQSLELHVWLSSSENICHAVHRSLSSGASVYACTMGFYLVPYCQPSPPMRFLLITAIGICHFVPVHHFGMACLAGSKVNIQHLDYVLRTSDDRMKDNSLKLTKERSRRYPAQTIMDADYADDIALLANTPAQAETSLHSLERAAAGIGLHVNANKMEYMCFNQNGDISPLNGSFLKWVDKFTYLPRKQCLINRDWHQQVFYTKP